MSEKYFDITVIGAGIVGLASALQLTLKNPKLKIAILETEKDIAQHQTGHNSGVIHSGLYYKPGSLKALNCVKGRNALYRFCEENNVKHDKCGKIVVATKQDELDALEILYQRGQANGLEGIKKLSADEIEEYEPNISGIAGLHVPETGIVDYLDVCRGYKEQILKNDNEIFLNTQFIHLQKKDDLLILQTTNNEVKSKNIINCGGLHSDRVAKMCGVKPHVKIIPFRGEYYELIPEKENLIKNLVYPVPNPKFPFLGVHFTRMVHGGVEAGPNAVLAFKREGYLKSDFSFLDTMGTMIYPGFWVLAAKYWYTGFGEIYRSASKKAFVKALRKLLPQLAVEDVKPAGSGVRAQALAINGRLLDDFQIEQKDKMIHVLNAPSPAATASLAIGETIADMALKNFNL